MACLPWSLLTGERSAADTDSALSSWAAVRTDWLAGKAKWGAAAMPAI